MDARFKATFAAVVLAVGAGAAKVAHLGPFADNAIRIADNAAMSTFAFKENYRSLRAGTLAEQQAVDIACSLFASLNANGAPPSEWSSFEDALAERMGVTDSKQYITGKVERVAATVDLAQRNPRAAAEYARHCLS